MKTRKQVFIMLLGLVLSVACMPQLSAQEVQTLAQEMPKFADGGEKGLMKFIADNLKYPADAVTGKKEGRVIARFVVGTDGTISDVKIISSLSPTCDAEVLRVMKLMPKWIPGKDDGKNVAVYYNIPVYFRLQTDKTKK